MPNWRDDAPTLPAPTRKIVPAPAVLIKPAQKPTGVNREGWLMNVAHEIIPMVERVSGVMMPNFRISCGWPSKRGLSTKRRVIGECWGRTVSADGLGELFISPMLHDPMDVAATVAHELIHNNGYRGHKKDFADVAFGIGLAGKATATVAGEVFKMAMDPILRKLGPYPHAAMKPSSEYRPAPTLLLKAQCPQCQYVVRVTRKWVVQGAPFCGIHAVRMIVAGMEEEGDGE